MDAFGVIVVIAVTVGVVAGILLFERQRAERIEEDLRRPGIRTEEQGAGSSYGRVDGVPPRHDSSRPAWPSPEGGGDGVSMEPIPETLAAFDELDPVAEDDLRVALVDAGRQVRALVPDCIGISIATIEHGVTFTLVASALDIAVLDAVQYLAGGPCVAVDSSDPLEADIEDFAEHDWQLFAQATAARGVQSTLTLPIMAGDRVIGSVNLYGASRRAFAGLHEQLADIFGAWAGGAVTNADLSFDTRRLAAEAPKQLQASATISTAVGVICAQLDVDEDEAHRLLGDAAACAGTSELRVAEALIRAWELGDGSDA